MPETASQTQLKFTALWWNFRYIFCRNPSSTTGILKFLQVSGIYPNPCRSRLTGALRVKYSDPLQRTYKNISCIQQASNGRVIFDNINSKQGVLMVKYWILYRELLLISKKISRIEQASRCLR